MINIFKNRSGKYPSESKWSVLQGKNDGKPMIVRRNDSAKQLSSNPDFAFRLGVAIPLLNPNDMGLPSNAEMDVLNQLEDELCNPLEKNQLSLLVLIITTNGMREFVFYTRDAHACENALNLIRSKFANREIQSYIAEDKKWTLYRQFSQ